MKTTPLYLVQHTSVSCSILLSGDCIQEPQSPERVAEEEVDDDDEEYPGLLLLLLLEEAQQGLGHDLGCNSIDSFIPEPVPIDICSFETYITL